MFGIDFVLLGFIAVNMLAAMSGAIFKPGLWYDRLDKPWWNPPKWAFPLAWTVIFAFIVVAGWWAWRAAGGFWGAPWAFVFYGLQLALNAGWSAVFFGMRRPDLALVEVGALWLSIAVTAALFFQIDAAPGWMMMVYLAWVTFAARLNHKIWRLNPDNGERLA